LQPLEPKNILRWSAAKTAITCRWLSMLMLMAGLGSGIALADKSDHPPGSGGVQVVIRQLPSSLTATGDDAPPATGPASARPSPKRPSPGVPAPPPSKPAPGPPPVAVGPGSGPFANLRDGGCTVIYPKNDPDSPRLIAEAKAMGRVLNAKRFGDDQWPALERLWNNESGWYRVAARAALRRRCRVAGCTTAPRGARLFGALTTLPTGTKRRIRRGLFGSAPTIVRAIPTDQPAKPVPVATPLALGTNRFPRYQLAIPLRNDHGNRCEKPSHPPSFREGTSHFGRLSALWCRCTA
jgi:hypothetical protein